LRVQDFAKFLGDSSDFYTSLDVAGDRLRYVLRGRAMLIVLDDIWHASHLAPFRIAGTRCCILFTSRSVTIAQSVGAEIVPLQPLDVDQSVELLRTVANRDDLSFKAIASRLGHLPLALQLVGNRLRTGISGTDWLAAFDGRVSSINANGSGDRDQNLGVCLELSLGALSAVERFQFASLGIFPVGATIPVPVIDRLWKALAQPEPREDHRTAGREGPSDPVRTTRLGALFKFFRKRFTEPTGDVAGAAAFVALKTPEPRLCSAAVPFSSRSIIERLAGLGLIELAAHNTVQQHNLLRALAAEHLGAEIASVQRRLLTSYNPTNQPWSKIEDDGYLWDNLVYHLYGALGWHGPDKLLRREVDHRSGDIKSNEWYSARHRADALDHYRADLDQALTMVSAVNEAAVVQGDPAPLIESELRYALFRASATSSTVSPPPAILRAIADERIVPLPQMLRRLRSIADVAARIRALITVSKVVTPTIAVTLLAEAERELEGATDALEDRHEIGFELAHAFLDRRCERNALTVIQGLPSALWVSGTAEILARFTSHDCLDDAFAWIEKASDGSKFDLLGALGSYDSEMATRAARALLAQPVRHMMDRDSRAAALAAIAPRLPVMLRSRVAIEVIETACQGDDIDVGRVLTPIATFFAEDDLERVFERIDRIEHTQFRVEALVALLQSDGRRRAADALRVVIHDQSDRDELKKCGIIAEEWDGLIEAARSSPDLRMDVLRDFLSTLSALGDRCSDGACWIKKIADILPEALASEVLDVVSNFPKQERAKGFTALLDLAVRVTGCLDRLICRAKALPPDEALSLLLGVAERCDDRREALIADVAGAIPTVDNAIARFGAVLRIYRLRVRDAANPAELDSLIAVLRQEGAAAHYFGVEREPRGLPRQLIQDALENALGQEQPRARFYALEAIAPHLDVVQLSRVWEELDRIGDPDRIKDAKDRVLEIERAAALHGIDGRAWPVAPQTVPGLPVPKVKTDPQGMLRFLVTLLEGPCNWKRLRPVILILLPQLIRIGETRTAIAFGGALAEHSQSQGLFDAEYAASLIAPNLDREALTEWATRLVEMTNPVAAAREFGALAASLPTSVREIAAQHLSKRLDTFPAGWARPGRAALLVGEAHAASPTTRDHLFNDALNAEPIDCQTLLMLEPILDETQVRQAFSSVIASGYAGHLRLGGIHYDYYDDFIMRAALRLPDRWGDACAAIHIIDKLDRVELYARLLRTPLGGRRRRELLDLAQTEAYRISEYQGELRANAILAAAGYLTDAEEIKRVLRAVISSAFGRFAKRPTIGESACVVVILSKLTRNDAYLIWREALLAQARSGRAEFLDALPFLAIAATVLGGAIPVLQLRSALNDAQQWWP
jgi:NB-ARC domain